MSEAPRAAKLISITLRDGKKHIPPPRNGPQLHAAPHAHDGLLVRAFHSSSFELAVLFAPLATANRRRGNSSTKGGRKAGGMDGAEGGGRGGGEKKTKLVRASEQELTTTERERRTARQQRQRRRE